jgi:hypothetical protein
MQLYLLYEERLGPIPENIEKMHDFGRVEIITKPSMGSVVGTSMILDGSQQAFVDWLGPFDHVWLGQGHPQEERFEVAHIKVP